MNFFGSITETVRFGILWTSICFFLAFANIGFRFCMQNDAVSHMNGDGIDQF